MRPPTPPNGHATNRDPVNPGRRQYPTPTAKPATYNSPTTPTGTGRNQPSNTNNAAPDPALNGALKVTHIVVSVGPYSLIITRPGAQRSTNSTGQASPPTSNIVDSRPSGESAPAADGV